MLTKSQMYEAFFRKLTPDKNDRGRVASYYNVYDLLGANVVEDVTVQTNRDNKLRELGI